MAAPTVESVNPANTQTGVVLGSPVTIIFDSEIDTSTVGRAFILEGADSDRWTGPDMILFDRPTTAVPDYYLDSPGYKGIVQGTFEYTKLDALGASVSSPTYDPSASTFKTKLVFTPDNVLAPGVEYRVYVAGDESSVDDIRIGIASRTVGDAELGANLGAGLAVFSGGFTGTSANQYVVQIVVAGAAGVAKYNWWRTSNPLLIRTGTVSENEVLLGEGVYLSFTGSDFQVGDQHSCRVDVPEYMTTTSTFTFTTGTGNITTVPTTTSTSIIGDVGVPVAATVFAVSESSPADLATNVSRARRTFTITFTNTLASSITEEQVIVDILPALGVYNGSVAQENVPKILSVSGNTLTIQI